MAIRIKFPDGKIVMLQSGIDGDFIELLVGDTFIMPNDFPEQYNGKYIVEERIPDDSPLDNLGDILVIKRV